MRQCVEVNSTVKYNKISQDAKSISDLKKQCDPTPGVQINTACYDKPDEKSTCKTMEIGYHP